ncbi:DUF3703 domain-containing protein [Spongiibacter marinus]|uniref:DUF3703 domain-containing protein n=1 Tax=Spongiibacter marinus TaxID=354246 RepID=UPI0004028591|nr:DUF3703 domain-containing protein [Spongiibacter marinus]
MVRFSKAIAPFIELELVRARQAEAFGDAVTGFRHLENAHVLGQESTRWHVKVHWLMFRWGLRQRDRREVVGQIIRIIGAAALTAIKGVPIGNTGGSNISPVKPLPIKPELEAIIAKAKAGGS